jgi:transposase
MAKPFTCSPDVDNYIAEILQSKEASFELYKKASIVFACLHGVTTSLTANTYGISNKTIYRYRDELVELCYNKGISTRTKKGGRYNQLLTPDEEKDFLELWIEPSLEGQIIDVTVIHVALENHLRKEIHISSVYNMLHRNGWRKLKPDKIHPKCDPVVQEKFKKKFHRLWIKPVN